MRVLSSWPSAGLPDEVNRSLIKKRVPSIETTVCDGGTSARPTPGCCPSATNAVNNATASTTIERYFFTSSLLPRKNDQNGGCPEYPPPQTTNAPPSRPPR